MQELTPTSCFLTSQRVPWHTHACDPIHRDTINAPRHAHLVLRTRRQRQAPPWGCGAGKAPAREAQPDVPCSVEPESARKPSEPERAAKLLSAFRDYF